MFRFVTEVLTNLRTIMENQEILMAQASDIRAALTDLDTSCKEALANLAAALTTHSQNAAAQKASDEAELDAVVAQIATIKAEFVTAIPVAPSPVPPAVAPAAQFPAKRS
jgi:ABC-type transporter Mla subunit MlaD